MATFFMPLKNSTEFSSIQYDLQLKSMLSSLSSATYGNEKMFIPRWKPDYAINDPNILDQINGLICKITRH
ncbi:hypothetical protein BH18THE2_BH18THE2_19810 [soil metagenome]